MSDFEAAVDYVEDALRALKARGANLTASRLALAEFEEVLRQAPPAEPARPSAPASAERERPREQQRPAPIPTDRPRAAVPVLPKLPTFTPPPAIPGAPPVGPGGSGKAAQLAALREKALACVKCDHLVQSRHGVVFGVGNPEAELMFVGEAPGADEDLQGEPFVGKAGQLLTKIIETMGFTRDQVYIANVLKCRPNMPAGASGNRKPTPAEMEICLDYLKQQIDIIRPRVLVGLGATALQGLAGLTDPMNRLRGHWYEFHGIPLMATFHPSYLLHNQSLGEKRKVWEDMLMVLEKLGRNISEKQRNFFLPK